MESIGVFLFERLTAISIPARIIAITVALGVAWAYVLDGPSITLNIAS